MSAFALPDPLEEIQFLDLETVDLFHAAVLLPGQIHGYKKKSDLEGAIGRPMTAAYYDERADLVLVAAYYWHGISTSHGYIDGNKRTGFVAMSNFLIMNGLEFIAPDYALGPWVEERFQRKEFDLLVLDDMIRRHTTVLTD